MSLPGEVGRTPSSLILSRGVFVRKDVDVDGPKAFCSDRDGPVAVLWVPGGTFVGVSEGFYYYF